MVVVVVVVRTHTHTHLILTRIHPCAPRAPPPTLLALFLSTHPSTHTKYLRRDGYGVNETLALDRAIGWRGDKRTRCCAPYTSVPLTDAGEWAAVPGGTFRLAIASHCCPLLFTHPHTHTHTHTHTHHITYTPIPLTPNCSSLLSPPLVLFSCIRSCSFS